MATGGKRHAAVLDFDDSVFKRHMARLAANRADARTATLREVARLFVDRVVATAPRDSHRFVRAYQIAGNDLGFGPYAVDAVRPARYKANRRRLQNQVTKWQFIVARYERTDRVYYKGVKRSGVNEGYLFARRALVRAERELGRLDPTALVIGGRKGKGGLQQLSTVRTKIHGGTGAWIIANGRTIARIHNREPHASIVEKNTRVVGLALRETGRRMVRRVPETYAKEVARGTPFLRAKAIRPRRRLA